jgi:P4 family phage/plasmid primase-like protien
MANAEHANGSANGWANLSLHDMALSAVGLGISIVPPREDGSKAPGRQPNGSESWSPYQNRLASQAEIDFWYGPATGLGLVCGSISGGLELFDFDHGETYRTFVATALGLGGESLIDRIESGYLELTPGEGVHWFYYSEEIRGSTKLATRPVGPGQVKTLIETKGQHGYAVIAPSFGRVHPSGQPYRLMRGSLATIATISSEERDWLWDLAKSFNESVREAGPAHEAKRDTDRKGGSEDDLSPGDDFNARMKWADILGPLGWVFVYQRGDTQYWRRPGKDQGISATINHNGTDRLHVFTSSTPFEPSQSYSKFGAYTILNHHGDFGAAARALAKEGFGTRREKRQAKAIDPPTGNGRVEVGEIAVIAEPPRFHLTDLGNAERLVERHGSDLRYCHPWKCWLVWDLCRWKRDDLANARSRAKETAISIFAETATARDDDERKAIVRWAFASEKRDRVSAMLFLAEAERGIPILPENLDRDPWLLNCVNGTLDLRTGELRAHRREDLITKLCPVTYEKSAKSPLWVETLERIFAGNQDLIRFWQRLCGYGLTGSTREQVLPILHGSGSNGKSTICNALLGMLGPDYAMKATQKMMMMRRTESHPTELADLFGKRLVVTIETEEGARLNETLIKELTGSDPIRARWMRENHFQFLPTHKLMLATNHVPTIRGTDHAIWRRLKLIPFSVKIPADEADSTMPERLLGELSGILAWCVSGCLEWQASGLNPPAEVTEATEQYSKDQDILGAFVAQCCLVNGGIRERSADIYAAYRTWAERSGEIPVNQIRFGKAMTERGFTRETSDGTWYNGIGLHQEWRPKQKEFY